ncbi:hypothetical protein M413DRAFT_342242 [Hebeloma cylindrosporum]|uniref:Uncharacterized protein n=1 Tax=Hebeloma cylindrosporum TaxID=76867 RepID=A0A0C2Y6P2_HEBCY|nr:hypothetical protein M413DRAFT_342242 [Hebeloma cylindrosporum h7]
MPSMLKSRFVRFFRPLLHAFGMSDPAPASAETWSFAQLLATDLQSNVSNYVYQLSTALALQKPWKTLLRVKTVFLVKQVSKTSEHEYFDALVELPDGQERYISFERAGSRPLYRPQSRLPHLRNWRSKSETALTDEQPAAITATQDVAAEDPGPISSSEPPPPEPEPIVAESPDASALALPKDRRILHRFSASVSSALSSSASALSSSSSSSSPSSSRSGVASMDSCSTARDAFDIVRGHAEPTQASNDVIMGTLFLESPDHPPIYLHELAVLAQTIHNNDNCYRLFTTNCYWFAGMMMDVLEKRINVQMQPAARTSWIGKVLHRHLGKSDGNWAYVTVYSPAPSKAVADVLAEFERNLAEFEKKIQENQEAQDLRLREAERKAEREQAWRKEEQKSKEEERRLKEEAEARVTRLEEEAKRERLAAAAREKELLERLKLLEAAN